MENNKNDVDRVLELILKMLQNHFQKLPRLEDIRCLEKGIQGCLLHGYRMEIVDEKLSLRR